VLITKYHSGDQMDENEIGRVCSAYGRGEERVLHAFVGEFEDLG